METSQLVAELSAGLKKRGVSNVGRRQLYQYLDLNRTYPDLGRTRPARVLALPALAQVSELVDPARIVRTASAQSVPAPLSGR